jgi:DNA gyrase subunit A
MTTPNQVRRIDIDQEMQQSYLDYAMSVIVSRALPDARDGLKPVQRRILYAMYDLGLNNSSVYKKSARIVGEVLGKYHPHGDMAVYEAMARMAQDFSMRCLLVDGQGNFGSVDGDPPAAMRYTEAKLTQASIEMLRQIEKNTVDFSRNFDGTLMEPDVLPAAFPNLLVNGATGIAVGMATNIPPHNLGEVIDALIYMLQHWNQLDDVSVEDLMKFIKGPDFPTGGVIIQDPAGEGLASIYGSGRGKVIIQARAHLEEMDRGKNRIIITELPYMVNKSSLIEKIAELVRAGNMDGVVDLRDESDRHGLRVVIELNKSIDPEVVLRNLYKRTSMQTTFGIALLALVGGEPRLLTLKQTLKVFLDHRLVVIQRKSEFELDKARQRAHILEGLRIAIKYLDEIIKLIRNSSDTDEAKDRLIKKYSLSDIQAQAILDMPLKRLAALERKKIEDEYREVTQTIRMLEDLLKTPEKIRQKVAEELSEIQKSFADKRKTNIIGMKEGGSLSKMLTVTDLMDSEEVWIAVNEAGEIARSNASASPWMSGKDAPEWLLKCDTHHTLYLVTDTGRAAAIPVHSVPEASQISEGTPVHKISALNPDDNLAVIFSLPQKSQLNDSTFITTATRGGMLKKSLATELPGPSAQTFQLCKVNEGDILGWVLQSNGSSDLILATTKGFCIRFNEDEVRPIGLVAAGVAGIKLGVGDEVVNISTINRDHLVVLLTTDGRAKRTPAKDYPTQGRYGMGVIGWKMTPGKHIAGMMVGENTEKFIVHFMKSISKPKKVEEIPQAGRAAQGKMVLEVKPGDQVIGITTIWDGVGKKAKHSKEDPETGKRSGKYESNLQLELFKPEKRARSSAKKEPKLQSPKKDTARTKTVSKPVRKVTKPKSINKAVSKDKNTSSKPKRTSTYRMTSTKTKPTTKVESEVKPQTGRGRPKKTP